MPQPHDIANLREHRDAALASAHAATERVQGLDAEIARAQRAGRRDEIVRLQALRATAEREAVTARNEGARLGNGAFGTLVDWLRQTPEQIVGALSDAFPFVLLPVRIEAKFARVDAGAELRVRFFPDDISVAPPPVAATDAELALGHAYWRARAAARHAPEAEALRTAYEGAWTTLATRVGAYRAGYIVRVSAPQNPDAAPDGLVFDDAPIPELPPTARADALPDRFVVLAYTADPTTRALNEVGRAVGAPIPDDLVLAPDPSQAETWISRDDHGRLVVPDALRWLVDFDAAVRVGMALRLPIAPPHDANGFDRVLAIGVRSSTPPQVAPALLESLLSKHRDSAGCGLLRAGTPTNNADVPASDVDVDQLFAIENAPPDITPSDGVLGIVDGARLASLLGLSHEFVRRLPNAAATDIAEAIAMNRAASPGTIDDFVSEFLKGIVSPINARDLHRFFVKWVSGRGLYPTLRVGRQPYGIVLTSAWRSWKFGPQDVLSDGDGAIAPALHELISKHRFRWEILARHVPHAGADGGGDAFQRFVAIVGLLASSADYVSRKAVSDTYLRERMRFGGADTAASESWLDALREIRDQSLDAMGFPPVSSATDPLLAFIVFLRETQPWRLSLVDRDPAVPLSESGPVGPYDGTHNYLWWLTQASRADLASERFPGIDGTSVPPPTALLYTLLRHAVLAVIEAASLDAARKFGSRFFDVIERDPLIANIGSEQHVLRRDYLEVDAARLGLARSPTALADWVLDAGRTPGHDTTSAAERIAEVNDAIAAIADLPTARLERLLAEHVDVCSYRIDAWVTALYAQRLASLHARADARGLHLGAFGWIEDLRPAARARVSAAAIPPALRDSAGPDVFEDAANGGHVHAPSLTQAATAGVLRNGYLSHADPAQPRAFAVNLSSGRVRAALALLDGVRSGQPLGALLGYQLERGLHERHAGLELDQFIGVLRDRFPLLSGRLSEIPAGTHAEVIEARNVVDGLALVEATRGKPYPFDIAGLPAPGTAEANAIAADVDRVHDALDAVSDLLLAESVHQAVQGNMLRTQAALNALTAPESAPEPEIIRTPRSGRVLAFRVVLALDPDAAGGWSPSLSPRARANPQINHWLSVHLPQPHRIRWTVRDGAAAPVLQSLAGLGLEPLDVVLMSHDRIGNEPGELERCLIRRFRAEHAVPDERATVVAPAPSGTDPAATLLFDFGDGGEDGVSLSKLHPLLARLRRLVTRSRPAHAGDWRRAADAADGADPTGSASGHPKLEHFAELTGRIDAAAIEMESAVDELKVVLDAIEPMRAALEADPETLSDAQWPHKLADLRQALFALASFGLPEAVPVDGLTVTPTLIDRLLDQARVVSKLGKERLARAAELRATAFSAPVPADEPARSTELARRNHALREAYVEAARALLGASFVIVVPFRFAADQASELQQALAAPMADPVDIEAWLHSTARVRPRISDLAWAFATTRWIDRPISDPAVAQLPFTPGATWIGGRLSPGLPSGECLALLVLDGQATQGPLQAGLLFDDWTETVPTDRETTGVAFNFNRPNAVAPQALLVAVAPELRGHWAWDDLVASVHEALDLTKLRTVEPDALIGRHANETSPHGDYFQALPAILSEFTAGRFATTDFAARVATALASPGD